MVTRRPNPRTTARIQARTQIQDASDVAVRMACGEHQITYYSPKLAKPLCPLCDSEDQLSGMRQALQDQINRNQVLERQVQRLAEHVDVVTAMKSALSITDVDDLTFLKAVCYQWRDDKSISLKVTHGKKRRKSDPLPVNGFISMPRKGEPEGYLCTSLGGIAIAGYFEEALRLVGPAQSMALLVKAVSSHLQAEMRS